MINKYKFPSIDKASLLNSKNKKLISNKSFLSSEQPILFLIANGYAGKNFYQELANKLELEYVEKLPVKINDSKSLANKIGTEIQSRYLFFAYLENKALIIATPDPTKVEEMVENSLPFLVEAPQNIKVKICPLDVVREALSQSAYSISNKLAEDKLKLSQPYLSSYNLIKTKSLKFFIAGFLFFLILLFFYPRPIILIIYIFINLFYFILNPIKFFITLAGFWGESNFKKIPSRTLSNLPSSSLPIYTILIPLKNEKEVAKKLIRNLKAIKYPLEKLDIKIILEVNDTETLAAIKKELNLSKNYTSDILVFDIIKVPLGEISTKPRSLNFALQFARGTLSVIYDAEDQPDPNQLKKVFLTLLDKKLDTLCVQAKLNYYNSKQNILTKLFTMEYSFWFDALLPGLQRWKIPIPLGGTSNHFLTEALRKIGMWDPYNVTEDADLGWRLARLGYSTSMVNSYTLEEANSQTWNWIKQRTRWQKGFLMTLLVHIRTPKKMWRELGPWGFSSSVLLFTTNFFLPVINPLLWLFFLSWYIPKLLGINFIDFGFPDWLEIVGLINLILGNGIYILVHIAGIFKTKKYYLLPSVIFIPFYWFLISFASYRAIWQIFKNPYSWEKTTHGLAK